jgi:uncharacterized protein YndB with AHSA1/START domain
MMTEQAQQTIQTLNIQEERQIAAPIEIVFQTILEPQGPLSEMNLKLEQWVGGRWFRDLGNNTGHLWGHVQVIKPPTLLEITGPLMMSYPAVSHLQYRLTKQGNGTLLKFTHQAIGLLTEQHMEGVKQGWNKTLDSILASAEKRGTTAKIA